LLVSAIKLPNGKWARFVELGTQKPMYYDRGRRNFRFCEPFYTFNSAEDYINALKSDPPKNFKYKIIASFEGKSSACLIYHFSKPGVNTPMAQFFKISDGKISEILLIFDTNAFYKK
jgi:hypothetical protein